MVRGGASKYSRWVRCAIDVQRAMAERNADIPADRGIEFRIGINVGDIIIHEGDIYRDGVNINPASSVGRSGVIFPSKTPVQSSKAA